MNSRITCPVDIATRTSSHRWAEHGLSFWLQTDSGPTLFESGTVLLHNLDALALDATTLRAVALRHTPRSHRRSTCPRGTPHPGLPLSANRDVLRERFSQSTGSRRAIGLPVDEPWLHEHFTLHLDDQAQQILPVVWTTGAGNCATAPGRLRPQKGNARGYRDRPRCVSGRLVPRSAE